MAFQSSLVGLLGLFFIVVCTCNSSSHEVSRGDNGGISCATCTILLSIGSQMAEIYNETMVDSLQHLCTFLPSQLEPNCQSLVQYLAPVLEMAIDKRYTVDVLCYTIGLCYVQSGRKMCNLFPLPSSSFPLEEPKIPALKLRKLTKEALPWICYLPGIYTLCTALSNTYTKLVPAVDLDEDRFSPLETLRGSLWRGRDCSDFDAGYRPGRRPLNADIYGDSNCNGIFGVNSTSGFSWEEELCGGSDAKGIVYIGDSVGAHFHVPVAWFTPSLLSSDVLSNVSYVVSNEFDWPDVGFATGFRNASYMPQLIDVDRVDSLYLRLRERNRCNHRDYQNLARNGATSRDTLEYMKSLSRNPREDRPALVIYSMVGNDVCNEKEDTLAHMTSPKEFYENVLKTLDFLEQSALPPGSHVILVGLIDGSILYKAMAHRYHPLGQLRKDLTYADVYDWFNCMEIGPCHGWMTRNDTLRAITTAHANRLSEILQKIARREGKRYTRFDIHYMPNPFQRVIDAWVKKGGQIWELIEPVDSLHPTQVTQSMIAESMWSYLEQNMPHVLGPVNDRNHRIQQLFGQQGGH